MVNISSFTGVSYMLGGAGFLPSTVCHSPEIKIILYGLHIPDHHFGETCVRVTTLEIDLDNSKRV